MGRMKELFSSFTPQSIAVLAGLCALGGLFVILGCALGSNWAALPVLFLLILVPVPVMLFERSAASSVFSSGGGESFATHIAQALSGAFLASAVGLIFVLARNGNITPTSPYFFGAAGVVFAGAYAVFHLISRRSADPGF